MKWRVGITVTAIVGAVLVAPAATASAASSPVYGTSFTVDGLGSGPVSGTASGFSFQVARGAVHARLGLPVSAAATPVLIAAAHQGAVPSTVSFTVKASGAALVRLAITKPTFTVSQQVNGVAQSELVQFTAKAFAWKTAQPWHPGPAAAAAGVLSVTATGGGHPAAVQTLSASVKASASGTPVTMDTQEPFDSTVSGTLLHALATGAALSRVALGDYKPGTRTVAVTDTASPARVLGFGETVVRAAFTDQVTIGAATAAVATPAAVHPAVRRSPGELRLPATAATPAMTIQLARVTATLAGKAQLMTTEPADTSVSPNLLKLAGVTVPAATLVLYARGGAVKIAGKYALGGLRLNVLDESAVPGRLDDTASFSFTQSSWTPPAYQQQMPAKPAAEVAVPAAPAADSWAQGVSVIVKRTARPGSPAIEATVTEPANPALSSLLLTAAQSRAAIPEIILHLFRPGRLTHAVDYKLRTVHVRTVTEVGGKSRLQDQFTLIAGGLSFPAPPLWHASYSHLAGALQVNLPGSPSTPLSYGTLRAAPAGVSVDTTEPFDSVITPALLDALISGQNPPGASVTWVQPGTTNTAVTYSTSSPGIKAFTESADGSTLSDTVDWTFPGVSETPSTWQGRVGHPAGSLAMTFPPQSETTVPVQAGTLSATDKVLAADLQLPFTPTLSADFLQAAVAGGASIASGMLSVYAPGTTTTTEAYGLSAPAVAFTETATGLGLSDDVTMTGSGWSYGSPATAASRSVSAGGRPAR